MRTLAVDLAMLRQQHSALTNENENMARRLDSLQKVDEVHIEIDVLA